MHSGPKNGVRRSATLLALLLALAACAPKGEKLYARAVDALARGDANAAIIDLKNLLQDEPQNARARAVLGQAFVATGQIELAEVELQKARDLGAPADLVLAASCRVLLARAQFDQVLQDCKPGSGNAAQDRELRLVTASALLALGRVTESQAAYEAILAALPEDVEAWIGYANALNQEGGVDAAKAALEKAPAAVKDDVRYSLALAGLYVSANSFGEAEAAYQAAVAMTEQKKLGGAARVMALGGLAESQLRQGKFEAAKLTGAALEKAAPENPMVMMLRGQIAAANGELDEARTLLEQAVNKMPGNADALILLSAVNVQQGQIDQAESYLKTVIAADPQNARAQSMLIEVRGRQGSTAQDSLAGLQAALQQNPDNPTMLATAGRLSLETGDRDQALGYLAEASRASDKGDTEAQINIASGYLMAGEVDRALEVLNAMPKGGAPGGPRDSLLLASLLSKGDTARLMTEAQAILARSGKSTATRNMVGSVYSAAGRQDLAREQFNEALRLEPGNVPALLNLARLELVAGSTEQAEARMKQVLAKDPKNLNATLGLAAIAGRRKDTGTAEKFLNQAVKDHPQSVEARVALAQHYLNTNQPDKAKAAADAMMAANPRDASSANARGVVMVSARDLPAAISSFEQARALDPASVQIAGNLARAQMLNGDAAGALSTLDSALATNPRATQLLALAAVTSLQSGSQERATGYVERLRQVAPGSELTAQMEGDLAMSQKRYADALAFYDKADPRRQSRPILTGRYVAAQRAKVAQPEKVLEEWLTVHPDDADVIGLLGESKRVGGDVDGAMRLYEKGIAKAPGNGVLLNNLAMIYIEKGDPRALVTAEKAYKALPKAAAIQDTYGWALFKAGQTERAVELLAEAATGMPNNAEVQYHYAAALAKAGRNEQALQAVQKALAGPLPPSLRADATRLLDDLK
jgi:putative PEP-CTERM system TPR-repeat lipoprotein